MRLAVVGGSLQGVEALYLANKAGWETLLIDREAEVPGCGLCDRFIRQDVGEIHRLDHIFKNECKDVELVVPALENRAALDVLVEWSKRSGVPLAFDPGAYAVTASKSRSNELFHRLGIPMPRPWPECGFPLLAKPDSSSGSRGVHFIPDAEDLAAHFPSVPGDTLMKQAPPGWVFQEYIEGPSYSLEILGEPGNYSTVQVTDLEMDALYDCCRVRAPSALGTDRAAELEHIARTLAEAIALKGLMDIEVIDHNGRLNVLEIDARLPSQTPTTVYRSTGVNMLDGVARIFTGQTGDRPMDDILNIDTKTSKSVVYEHVGISSGVLAVCGEHIMADARPLRLHRDFFGADEALTDYQPGAGQWNATLVISGTGHTDTLQKRDQVIRDIHRNLKLGATT